MSAWIRMVAYGDSEGYLRELYDKVKGPQGQIDNVMIFAHRRAARQSPAA